MKSALLKGTLFSARSERRHKSPEPGDAVRPHFVGIWVGYTRECSARHHLRENARVSIHQMKPAAFSGPVEFARLASWRLH